MVVLQIFQFSDQETEMENCTQADVRLQDGPNVREGRLEICINKAWGTVCSTQFSDDDAAVACSQMKFERTGIVLVHVQYA